MQQEGRRNSTAGTGCTLYVHCTYGWYNVRTMYVHCSSSALMEDPDADTVILSSEKDDNYDDDDDDP